MKQDKLSNLFDFLPKSKVKAGDGLDDGKYPFYTSSENQSKCLDEYQHEPGCLVFGTGGKASAHFTTSRFATSTDCITMRPNQKVRVDAGYVFQFFKGNMQVLESGFKGAGLKHISKAYLSDIQIPLPPLDDQKRIAHLLGKVEGLIARRKQHLQQLDDLLKSVFLEMFGDPVRNEKGWDEREIGKSIKIKHGFAFKSEFFCDEGPYILLTPGNFFEAGGFRDRGDRQKYYTGETPEEYILNEGSLLIAMTEQAPGLLGSPLIVPESNLYLHNQRLGLAVPKEPIQTRFLFHLFNQKSIRQIIHSKATGTKVRHTSPTKLEGIVVGYPPLDLQNQFAAIVEKVEVLKSCNQQSLNDLENLYGTLSQKAFKGELDLSRVVLPVKLTTEDTESTETHRQPKPLTQGFARQLLAAEILHRHNVHNLTQMKLQKLIHLAEHHAELDEIQGEYQRQAAGPYDNKMMYGIASSLKKQRWFATSGRGQNATYSPLANAGCHEKYLAHWRGKMVKVDEVLGLLGHASPAQCEIASTLYAAWNDLLIDGEEITDGRIIEQASKAELWHVTKEAIDPDRWPKALQWMRDHDLVPTGYGKHTRKLK